MTISANDIASLVDTQLALISDATVQTKLRECLVSPSSHTRRWDYGEPGQTYECWTIATHTSTDTAIVYSEYGFGPQNPWGLVWQSKQAIGMDSAWFKSLAAAFIDSFVAGDLSIWNVIERHRDQHDTTQFCDLPLDEAFRRRDELASAESVSTFHVVYRGRLRNDTP